MKSDLFKALFICILFFEWEQSCFVLAMGAAYEDGYVSEAVRCAECVAFSGCECLFAAFAKVFVLGGVLCRDKSGYGKRAEK